MKVSPTRTALLLPIVLASTFANAELEVIYDSGNSWPIARYLEPMQPKAVGRSRGKDVQTAEISLGAADVESLLPLVSPGLKPGPVVTKPFRSPVPVAFFLIGADPVSLAWLHRHQRHLEEKGAIGLLVQAHSKQDLEAVASLAKGLSIVPANGVDVANALGLSHYPFAITDGRLWQ